MSLHALAGVLAAGPDNVVPNTGETLTFWVCAALCVIGALGMVMARKAVHSALFLAMTMISLAVLYVAQDALFLGMVQIIVYTGAVMMLFIFVLMVVGVDASDSLVETLRGQRLLAGLAFLGFLGLLLSGILRALDGTNVVGLDAANTEHGGNVQGIGVLVFTRYLLAFEVTSALLITAALGAMVLTHRERVTPRKSQAQRAVERFAPGAGHPGNKPTPGVYARNNAVDMPALLPGRNPRRGVGAQPAARSGRRAGGGPARPRRGPAPRGARLHDRRRGPGGRRPGTAPWRAGGALMNPTNYLVLSAILFSIGAAGVLVRRNAIVVFMCIELMLNASNLAFVTFARTTGNLSGQVVAFFVMVVAAAEVVVGLAIIVTIFRARNSASVDEPNLLRL